MDNKITTVVIPATKKIEDKGEKKVVINEELNKIKDLIQESVFYLEKMTNCRYYPVPTIIVDEIPSEDLDKQKVKSDNIKNIDRDVEGHETYKKEIDKDNKGLEKHKEKRGNIKGEGNSKKDLELHFLGAYFQPGYKPSQNLKDKLINFGYNPTFINSLFLSGTVVIAYDKCEAYADKEYKKYKDEYKERDYLVMWGMKVEEYPKYINELKNFSIFFWNIFNAVLIHEHAHAITVEGIDSKCNQLQYPYANLFKTYAYKIVYETLSEWLVMNKFRDNNPLLFIILNEHAGKNKSLYMWPYGGAKHIEEVCKKNKNIFIKIFNSFRKNVEDAIPLFLNNADEFAIKLFCAYKTRKNFKKLCVQIASNKNVLTEAIKFIENEDFLKKIVDSGADVNEQDACGNTALKVAISRDHFKIVEFLLNAGASVDNITMPYGTDGMDFFIRITLNNLRDEV